MYLQKYENKKYDKKAIFLRKRLDNIIKKLSIKKELKIYENSL